jgi:uncharacterized protein YuzB (UPF0349 family)
MERHAPGIEEKLEPLGGVLTTVDCFDRCEQCERSILCRLDGTMIRFRSREELIDAVLKLQEDQ